MISLFSWVFSHLSMSYVQESNDTVVKFNLYSPEATEQFIRNSSTRLSLSREKEPLPFLRLFEFGETTFLMFENRTLTLRRRRGCRSLATHAPEPDSRDYEASMSFFPGGALCHGNESIGVHGLHCLIKAMPVTKTSEFRLWPRVTH